MIRWAPRSAMCRVELTPHDLGLAGERLASRSLRRSGWRIRAHRLQTPEAEVDLVIESEEHLVCVEVKTARVPFRPRALGEPEPVLRWRPGLHASRQQLARLQRAARRLARSCGKKPRVDLIEIFVARDGRQLKTLHHPDCRKPPAAPTAVSATDIRPLQDPGSRGRARPQ